MSEATFSLCQEGATIPVDQAQERGGSARWRWSKGKHRQEGAGKQEQGWDLAEAGEALASGTI